MPQLETIEVQGFRCKRCRHVWVPRDPNHPPKVCPNKKCKSAYWDVPRKEDRDVLPVPGSERK